jgi:hypothetical protein
MSRRLACRARLHVEPSALDTVRDVRRVVRSIRAAAVATAGLVEARDA